MGSAYGRLPINALRVFEAVATRLSFAEAAEALSVTPAAVSQQIKALEDYLQIPLLRRQGRNVELTPEGARLLPGVQQGLSVLLASLGELRKSMSTGALHVSTLPSTLQKWLAPRLHRLHEQLPELQVDWHTSQEAVDFSRSDFHAAIRFGPGVYPGMYAERLMGEWSVAVAAPEVLARYGSLDEHSDFSGLPLLRAKHEPWSRWQQATADSQWPASPGTIDDSASMLVAAAEGLGYAVTRWTLAAQDIEHGRLVLASAHVNPSEWWHWFVCPEAYKNVPKVAAFRDWLVAEAAAFPPPPGPPQPIPPRKERKSKR
jgi:LysR family glycine cleavage system transcriptional activator